MRRTALVQLLVGGQRWFFLSLLAAWAPWAYGSTRPWAFQLLSAMMGVLVAFWLLSSLLQWAWPKLNPVCLGSALFLLIHGWWMVWNAKAALRASDSQLVPLGAHWPTLPGSIEQGLSCQSMQRYSGLLLIACFVLDLSQRSAWRLRLWWTIGLTGTSIALFGLIERVSRAPMIFWATDRESNTFFATYLYHANAGAYLNLVLPLIIGLALRSWMRKREAPFTQAFWMAASLLVLAAAFVNFSRGAQYTTIFLLLLMGLWRLRRHLRGSTAGARHWLAFLGLAAVLLYPIGLLWQTSTSARWAELGDESATDRLFAAQVTARMVPDAGPLGFGPGAFQIGFPFYITQEEKITEPAATGFWRYAHNDYLQTAAEWGWIGATAWAVFFGGGLLTGLRTYFRSEDSLSSSDRFLLFTSCLALTGIALHSVFDFPLQIASLQLYTSTYLGIAWGSPFWLKGRTTLRTSDVSASAEIAAT